MLLHPLPGILAWTIGSASMVGPGFRPASETQFAQLWAPGPLTIDNQPLSGMQGDLARRPGMPGTTVAVEMAISCDYDQDGDPITGVPSVGIDLNYADLVDVIGNPDEWAAETVETSLTRPSGIVMSGPIQPSVSPIMSESGGIAICVVSVVIPFGQLTASAGSA